MLNIIKQFINIDSKQNTNLAKSYNDNITLRNCIADLGEFYFLANKGNCGDIVIACAEFQYFETCKFKYKILDKNNLPTKPFTLVYGGGGIWTSYYKNYYHEILEIFSSPNLKKCVILPSSFWKCEDLMNVLDENFTVFCRDENSYNYCIQNNSLASFYLSNDMVVQANFDVFRPKKFYDYNKIKKTINNNKNILLFSKYKQAYKKVKSLKSTRIGYLLRNDCEKQHYLPTKNSFDLSDIYGGECSDYALALLLGKLFIGAIDLFDTIVTDRLHVGICAAKLGKEVLLLDNTYKKISSVYYYSLKEMTNVHLINKNTFYQALEYYSKNAQKTSNNTILKTLPKNQAEYLVQYNSLSRHF